MIDAGEASVEDIDFAIVNGPGPRWAMMGPCLTYHIGGGERGMEYCLEQFGPALKLPWSRMQTPSNLNVLKKTPFRVAFRSCEISPQNYHR